MTELNDEGWTVEKLAAVGCTKEEVQSKLGFNDEAEYNKGRNDFLITLRVSLCRAATKGDTTVLKMLAEQHLNGAAQSPASSEPFDREKVLAALTADANGTDKKTVGAIEKVSQTFEAGTTPFAKRYKQKPKKHDAENLGAADFTATKLLVTADNIGSDINDYKYPSKPDLKELAPTVNQPGEFEQYVNTEAI